MKETVFLATFNELPPAQRLQERLVAAGISATIEDQSKLERFWYFSPPLAAVHVSVPQPQYLRARRTLEELDHVTDLLRDAVRCPECGSSRIEFPQLSRKSLLPVAMRFFMWLGVAPKEFYCLDCQCTWPINPPKHREFDILGFPRDSRFWHPESAQSKRE